MHDTTSTPMLPWVALALGSLLVCLTAAPTSAAPCGGADSEVSVSDGVNALRSAAGLSSACTLDDCDIDGNGDITVTDGVQMLRAAAELPNLCDVANAGDDELRAAIADAAAGLNDPWGADLPLLMARTFTHFGIRTGGSAASSASAELACTAPESSPCLHTYCPDADYCGFPSNSSTAPGWYWSVNECLNRACFQHDLDSFQRCVAGSLDPCGTPTGRPDCYFSPQSELTGVDDPFFAACDTCGTGLNNRLVCLTASVLRDFRPVPAECRCPACAVGTSCEETLGVCNDDSGTCDGAAAACAVITGSWDAYEILDLSCTIEGETFADTIEAEGSIYIEQDGCTVSYAVPGSDIVRRGEVSANTLHITGPFAFGLAGVHLTENRSTVTGTIDGDTIALEGDGVVAGSADGESFRCTGSSLGTFTRGNGGASFRPDRRSATPLRSGSGVVSRLGLRFR